MSDVVFASEGEVLDALAKTFEPPEYAFIRGVRNQTGYSTKHNKIRTCDGMALGLWQSRGHILHGFEVKVTRSDVVKELKDPAKGDETARYCHHYWLALGSADLVSIDDVPLNWGVLVPARTKMKAIK